MLFAAMWYGLLIWCGQFGHDPYKIYGKGAWPVA